jgi:hypothetical protein
MDSFSPVETVYPAKAALDARRIELANSVFLSAVVFI